MEVKKVHYLKSGAPYGYGYTNGQQGIVRESDFQKLLELGVVRELTAEESKTLKGGEAPLETAVKK